jgi:uncharacterized protein (DUF305 family)
MKKAIRWGILAVLSSTVALPQANKVDANWSALGASMQKMHLAMASVAPSGDSDVDFVRLMLPHHQAALDMARTQLVYGKDPQVRRLAQEIVTDQQSEIELMQLWLKQHERQTSKLEPGSDVSAALGDAR